MRREVKDSGFQAVVHLVSSGVSLTATYYGAAVLGLSEYGKAALVLGAVGLSRSVCTVKTTTIISYDLSRNPGDEDRRAVLVAAGLVIDTASFLATLAVVSLVYSAIVFVWRPDGVMFDALSSDPYSFFVLGACAGLATYGQTLRSLLIAHRNGVAISKADLYEKISLLALMFALLRIDDTARAVVWSSALSRVLGVSFLLWYSRKWIEDTFRRSLKNLWSGSRKILSETRNRTAFSAAYLTTVLSAVQEHAPVVLLGTWGGSASVGALRVAMTVRTLGQMLEAVMTRAAIPILASERRHDNRDREARGALRWLIASTIGGFAVLCAVAAVGMAHLLSAPEAAAAAAVIAVGMVARLSVVHLELRAWGERAVGRPLLGRTVSVTVLVLGGVLLAPETAVGMAGTVAVAACASSAVLRWGGRAARTQRQEERNAVAL